MPAPVYHFVSTWDLAATPEEICDVLIDVGDLARWWPSVWLMARMLERGDDRGIGTRVELWTKGWLPYTLRWESVVTASDPPRGFTIAATGDFRGRGVWTITPQVAGLARPRTRVIYDWRIGLDKPILRRFGFALRPVFRANHEWAMRRGEESLKLELARRRARGDPTILEALPAPPGPTFPHNLHRQGRSAA